MMMRMEELSRRRQHDICFLCKMKRMKLQDIVALRYEKSNGEKTIQ